MNGVGLDGILMDSKELTLDMETVDYDDQILGEDLYWKSIKFVEVF